MTEKDQIMAQLEKIVRERGGKAPSKYKKLAEVDDAFVNQYEDDGSMKFIKMRQEIIKKIALDLYGDASLKGQKSVPENVIDRVIAELRKQRNIEIESERKKIKQAEKGLRILEKDKDIVKYAKRLAAAKGDFAGKTDLELYDMEHTGAREYKPFGIDVGTAGLPRKIPDDVKALVEKYYGSGVVGGKQKRKRAPSAYNKHIGREIKNGKTFKQAVASWNK